MFKKISSFLALALFCVLEHAVVACQMLSGSPPIEIARFGDEINKGKVTHLEKFMVQGSKVDLTVE